MRFMSALEQPACVAMCDEILREWLSDPDAMLVVGRWGHGAVAEILPRGKARLSQAGYEGRFAGMRDLRIEGEPHHMHLDLSRFRSVRYTVRGSVCYGWRPSLEIDLIGDDELPGFSLSAGNLYRKDGLRAEIAQRFFERLFEHRRRYGALVEPFVRPTSAPVHEVAQAWRDVAACFCELRELEHTPSFDLEDPVGSLRDSLLLAVESADSERAGDGC